MTVTDIIYDELSKHCGETILIKSPKESEEWNGEKYVRKDVIGTLTSVASYTEDDGKIDMFAFVKTNNGRIERDYEITNVEFEFLNK